MSGDVSFGIYYDDGSVYGSLDGEWDGAPAEGVLAVVEKVGERQQIHTGADYYYRLEDGTVVSTADHATILRSLGWIKFGRYTSNAKMESVLRRIREEWSIAN